MKLSSHHFFLTAVLLTGIASAQVSTGTPPFGSFGGGPFDTVNLGNLNVHFVIPVLNKAGRGMPFSYNLSYDSSVWTPVASSGLTQWQPANNWGWRGQSEVATGYLSVYTFSTLCKTGNVPTGLHEYFENWVYHDTFGVAHMFPGLAQIETGTCGSLVTSMNSLATDGSGYTLKTTSGAGNPTIISRGGKVINPPYQTSSGAATATDANGNQITVNGSGQFFDTLSSTTPVLTVSSAAPPSPTTFTYAAPGGSASYTMNYTQYTVATNFGVTGITEYGPLSNALVNNIQLPDGSSYSFTYEQTPGTCTPLSGTSECVTGRILKVTLPTGGTITYAYTGGSNGTGIYSDGSTGGLNRTLSPGGEWKYSRTLVTGTPGTGSTWTTTIVDPTVPNGNYTVINSAEDGSTSNPTYNFYETQRKVYQGSVSPSNLLATIIKCYNAVYAGCATATVSSQITQTDVYSQLPNNSTRLSETTYNIYNLVTDDKEYNYGVAMGSAPGTTDLIRETAVAYASLGNGIVNKPSSVIVYDWTSSTRTTLASTTYSYDQTGVTSPSGTPQHVSVSGSRGNLTTLTTSTSSTASLSKAFTYYDTGNPNVATDVNSAQTTYVYSSAANPYNSSLTASCGNSFATTINEPLSLSRSVQWNCVGGIAEQATDENGQVVKSGYTDPDFWRPANVYDQENNETTISYIGQTAVEAALNFNSGNSVSDSRTTVDGFGRPILSQRLQGPGTGANYDTAETDYNSLGQPDRSTMPFSAAAGGTSSTAPSTNTTYDALGRVLTVTDADSGTVTYTYTNNDVLQQVSGGTQTFQKQFEYDGLGRLTSVCEISSTLPGIGTCGQVSTQSGYWTKYTYDALGHLLTVAQNAQTSGSLQNRTYNYDLIGRLTSESNPETGTFTYTYDTVPIGCYNSGASYPGKVVAITKNGTVTECPAYDALGRLYYVTAQGYCQRFAYDDHVYWSWLSAPGTISNGAGRLTEVETDNCTGNSGTQITDEWFSYSPRGELTDVYESTPHSGGYYHSQASYWPTGTLNSLSAFNSTPTALFPTIYYGASGAGLDGEGRVTQVSAASGTSPVTSVTYSTTSNVNPLGSLTGVTFGSADSDSFTYDPNTGRMGSYTFSVNGKSDAGTLKWNANGTLGKLVIADTIPGTADSETCNYLYDDLQRLSSANCGTPWSQTFTYDTFGNITKSGSISFVPGYSATTNQFTNIPGVTVRYDANGNLLTDNLNSYTWDAFGNIATVNTGSAVVTATYDGMGRMVENNAGGSYTEIIYGPTGKKLATATGLTLVKAFIALPGGAKAIYNSTGLTYYRHSDWVGNSRLASTASRTMYSSTAYAPFGEVQQGQTTGTADASFTGQDQDTAGSLYDFTFRRYSPSQGRWISPDPAGTAAVSLSVPQSWNRYGYAYNNPLALIDPTGLDPDCGPDELGGSQCGGQLQGTDSTNASSGTGPGDGIVLGDGGNNPALPSTGDPITPTVPGTSITVYGTYDPVESTVVDVTSSLADNVPFGQILTLTGGVRGPACTNYVMADCGAANKGPVAANNSTPPKTFTEKLTAGLMNAGTCTKMEVVGGLGVVGGGGLFLFGTAEDLTVVGLPAGLITQTSGAILGTLGGATAALGTIGKDLGVCE